MFILQETCIDIYGSLVIYVLVDIPAMNLVMQSGDPTYVAFFPSRFVILLDKPKNRKAITTTSHMSGNSGA